MDALARREITARAFATGIALSLFADNRTGESRPSVATIAKRIGAPIYKDNDSRTVRDALAALERAGLLDISRRGHMKPNLYRPRCPRNDRRTTADMIGEPPPTNSSTELSNHSLSLRAVESEEPSGDGDDAGLSDRFKELTGKFPFNGTMSRSAARREFAKLALSDRELAIRDAAEYASACKHSGIRFPRHLATWLRDREFDHARRESFKTSRPAQVFVERGTPAWDAWSAAGSKRWPITEQGGKAGWWFPSELPSAQARAAE